MADSTWCATGTSSPGGILELDAWDEDGHLLAVIEAPRGSANKLKFDPRHGVFRLHQVLPLGCVFPFDFGFVPRTLGDDGDPLDVLVLMDEPAAPGVVVPCRLVGVIEATQRPLHAGNGTRGLRNDRLVAVAHKSHRHGGVRGLRDVGDSMLDEIERFFVFYNAQKGVRFTVRGRAGLPEARRLVAKGRAAAAR